MSAEIAFFPAETRRAAAQAAPRTASAEGPAPDQLSRDQIDALVARGRRLQAEAVRDVFRALGRHLVGQIARSPRLLRGRSIDRPACC